MPDVPRHLVIPKLCAGPTVTVRKTHRLARWAVFASAAALLVACGDDDDTAGSGGCRAAEGGEVTIVAKNIAWDTDCLEAPAGEPLTIIVDNQDRGLPHNIHLTDAPGGPKTELEPGLVTQELEVTLDAGSYQYLCDIHPNMVGTLTMTEANPADP